MVVNSRSSRPRFPQCLLLFVGVGSVSFRSKRNSNDPLVWLATIATRMNQVEPLDATVVVVAQPAEKNRRKCVVGFWWMCCFVTAFAAFVLAAIILGAVGGDTDREGQTTFVEISTVLGGVTSEQFEEPIVQEGFATTLSLALNSRGFAVLDVSGSRREQPLE